MSNLTSGTIPSDDVKKQRRAVIDTIVFLDKILELSMINRGCIVEAKLYRQKLQDAFGIVWE